MVEKPLVYDDMRPTTGLTIRYIPQENGAVKMEVQDERGGAISSILFSPDRIDEAHILYMEATELLSSRVKMMQEPAGIRAALEKLFALFRGEEVSFKEVSAPVSIRKASGEFIPNPGKKIEIDVGGAIYQRLPVRTRLIDARDTDLKPLLDEYVKLFLQPGDLLFISEKVLTIVQGRVVDMSTIKPTSLARFLAGKVGNSYGSKEFHGFGHGTALAMQLFLEETGYVRILFAAAVAALTKPFGIKGMFYRICGKRAKSIDCPMSFLILEYAHAAKLAPNKPSTAAREYRDHLGCETVILDANYRGAFSLGKSTRTISEAFIGQLFRDNPLGQSDEMTPFCIVRKTS